MRRRGHTGNGSEGQTRLIVGVLYEWRAAVKTPSVHTVPIVDGAAAKALEGRGGGVRVEAPAHPFGWTLVGRQDDGGGTRVPADYEGRMHRSRKGPPGGQGGGHGWRGGRARAALDCIFSFFFSLVRFYLSSGDESGGFLCLSFVFPTGSWGPDYDRLGRY